MRSPASFPLFSIPGLSREELTQLAFEEGLCQRKSGKIDIPDLFHTFCLQSLEGTVSYNDLAAKIESTTGNNVSRQAYQQRMGRNCVAFFKRVLETIIKSHYPLPMKDKLKGTFKRALVQDSTILRLPARLFEHYSGVKNAAATVCNARIQGIYDLISRQFISFSIDPYKKTIFVLAMISPLKKVI